MGHLVLSRKVNESIVIDDGRIVVTVVQLRGDKARLGVRAEDGIRIDRLEIHELRERERIDRERRRQDGLGPGEGR